jgi:hypothetical protein
VSNVITSTAPNARRKIDNMSSKYGSTSVSSPVSPAGEWESGNRRAAITINGATMRQRFRKKTNGILLAEMSKRITGK